MIGLLVSHLTNHVSSHQPYHSSMLIHCRMIAFGSNSNTNPRGVQGAFARQEIPPRRSPPRNFRSTLHCNLHLTPPHVECTHNGCSCNGKELGQARFWEPWSISLHLARDGASTIFRLLPRMSMITRTLTVARTNGKTQHAISGRSAVVGVRLSFLLKANSQMTNLHWPAQLSRLSPVASYSLWYMHLPSRLPS
jgi:hypothetical protein